MTDSRWSRHLLVPVLVVLAAATVLSLHKWGANWQDPDSLFYQAQSLEVRGDSQSTALKEVFDGPPGRASLAFNLKYFPRSARAIASSSWVNYSARLYRRRWAVPAAAAALNPLFGGGSLEVVSVLGYFAIGTLLYALLRRRFSVVSSVVVAIACLWLPPVRWYSFASMTDSWGVALLLLALIAAVVVGERGLRWLPFWVGTLVIFSLTKEDYFVAVLAACLVAVRVREKRWIWLAASGVIAVLPASLLLGPSVKEIISYDINNLRPPPSSSWSYVFSHYGSALESTVRQDVLLPHVSGWSAAHTLVWYAGCAVVLAGIVLLVLKRGRDPFFGLLRATLLSAAAFIVVTVNFTTLRLELVFLPPVAVGLALLAEAVRRPLAAYVRAALDARLGRRRAPASAPGGLR